ncbi:hypothetical protein, partial [Allochromatium vinosum]|uniref:hypothetical protein n=1 Tax=Allochromatium vinosum TaxID=1049 RepID=UPI001A91A611
LEFTTDGRCRAGVFVQTDDHGNETFSCSFWTRWAVLKLRDESLENLSGKEQRITPSRHIITRDATVIV